MKAVGLQPVDDSTQGHFTVAFEAQEFEVWICFMEQHSVYVTDSRLELPNSPVFGSSLFGTNRPSPSYRDPLPREMAQISVCKHLNLLKEKQSMD